MENIKQSMTPSEKSFAEYLEDLNDDDQSE